MLLKSVQLEFGADGPSWQLRDLVLRNQNLIVGQNTSGKSTVILLINFLAMLVCGDIKFPDISIYRFVHWIAIFDASGQEARYELSIQNFQVIKEQFSLGTERLLDRVEDGIATIRDTGVSPNVSLDIQVPTSELAAVNRHDRKRHPFFQDLHDWGLGVLAMWGATDFEKGAAMLPSGTPAVNTPQERLNRMATLRVLQRGLLGDHSSDFKNSVIADMSKLSYGLNDIGLRAAPEFIRKGDPPTVSFHAQGVAMQIPIIIFAQEASLDVDTPQHLMSLGMFRSLAIISRLNLAKFMARPTLIMIDDFCEGLDYERSCALRHASSQQIG